MTVLDIPVRDLENKQDRLTRAIEAETRFGVGATFRDRRAHAAMDADWTISPVTKQNKDHAGRNSAPAETAIISSSLVCSRCIPKSTAFSRERAAVAQRPSTRQSSQLFFSLASRSLDRPLRRCVWCEISPFAVNLRHQNDAIELLLVGERFVGGHQRVGSRDGCQRCPFGLCQIGCGLDLIGAVGDGVPGEGDR